MKQSLEARERTPEYLAAHVLRRNRLLIMTDYDGTLVPIRERPEFALPGPGLLKVIKRLAKNPLVLLAIISGREADQLKKLIPVDGIYLIGCHGAEILYPNGERFTTIDEKKLAPVMEMIADQAISCSSDQKGFIVERKKVALALHYRMADRSTAIKVLLDFITAVKPIAMKNNLEFITGKKVIEVRFKGINKGKAARYLMKLHPDFYPIYLGDDKTDEDAFKEVQEKGLGILVLEHTKATAASHWLRSPNDVLRFMQIIS